MTAIANPVLIPVALLALTAATLQAGPQADPSTAYVQATIVDANPSAGTLGFVTASGRSRVARIEGGARARVPNLRAGDEVILTLVGPAERPTITGVKVSRLAPAPPVPDPVATAAMVTGVPSRPSWPNPYSRINPGLPFRPGRAARAPGSPGGGTLNVMPAGLVMNGGAPGSQPIAAPAVAVAPPLARTPVAPPVPAAASEASTVDALRERGAREFEAAVKRLAAEARSVDAAWARYLSACPTAVTADEGSRGWLDLKGGAATGGADPSCAVLVEEIQQLGAPIKVGMLAAHEAARRAWVLPGTLREIRSRHAMEWSGWDR